MATQRRDPRRVRGTRHGGGGSPQLGIVFQFASVAPMRGLGLRQGVLAAIKIDTLSLLAYEVGMFGWMGVRAWLFLRLEPTAWSYWLMMQIAMVIGFGTTFPVNWWLISRGIKEKM